jgi:hypothetical protein
LAGRRSPFDGSGVRDIDQTQINGSVELTGSGIKSR